MEVSQSKKKEHANATTEHLDANQTKEITERNKRVANELNDSLTALKEAFNTKSPPTAADIKGKLSNLDALLGEVLSVCAFERTYVRLSERMCVS